MLCESNSKAVLASDRMITVSFLSHEFEHPTPKSQPVSESCVILSAGSALLPTEVFHDIDNEISSLKNPGVAEIVERVKARYVAVRRKKAEETYLRPRGLTIEGFYKTMDSLPAQLAAVLDQKIEKGDDGWGLELIIAGVDGSGAHIYLVEDPGVSSSFDSIGFVCTGSGSPHAFTSFIASGYAENGSLNEAVYRTYEAKRRSERAPGVGPTTDMWIVTKEGVRKLKETVLVSLRGIYDRYAEWESGKLQKMSRDIGALDLDK